MVVIIDCNIWVSLAINRQIDFIADLSDAGVVIASCVTLRNEIADVLYRPKFTKLIPDSSIAKLILLHDTVTTAYVLNKIPYVISDQKDNYLFALSVRSKADYLVTGDKLVLTVAKYKKTQLINFSEFKRILTELI